MLKGQFISRSPLAGRIISKEAPAWYRCQSIFYLRRREALSIWNKNLENLWPLWTAVLYNKYCWLRDNQTNVSRTKQINTFVHVALLNYYMTLIEDNFAMGTWCNMCQYHIGQSGRIPRLWSQVIRHTMVTDGRGNVNFLCWINCLLSKKCRARLYAHIWNARRHRNLILTSKRFDVKFTF